MGGLGHRVNVGRAVARRPHARKVALTAVRTRARIARKGAPPRVLILSLAKSGTHLATAILNRLPDMRNSGRHLAAADFVPDYLVSAVPREPPLFEGDRVDWAGIRRLLKRPKPGQFMTGHFPASPRLSELLAELGYRSIFLYRDPRDIAVSRVSYIKDRRDHPLHNRYMEVFETDDERLLRTITGFPGDVHGRGSVPLHAELAAFLPWRDAPGTLHCRFEDLVGGEGGQADRASAKSVMAIGAHALRPVREPKALEIASRDSSAWSPTFRRGVAGEWRSRFQRSHLDAFRGRAAEMVAAYGYEVDGRWIDHELARKGI